MSDARNEDELLKSVALRNAQSILQARLRAEEELLRTKESLEQKTRELVSSHAELRQQSELLKVTLASIGDAVITTDHAGHITSLNAVAQSLTGWSQSDAQGRPLAEIFRIVNEQTRQPVENPADRALQEGRVVGLANHTILIARDGTEIPIDDSAAPIRDAAGQVQGVILVFRDITPRKLAEQALRRNERDLAEFFENAAIGLHWAARDGTILRVNRAELEMLGYQRDEYLGRHIADFHADRQVIEDILRRLMAGEELHDHPARLLCKDGSIKHVLINSNVLWEDGEFIHTRCFTRDVTDRKHVEEAHAQLAAIVESSDDAIISKTMDSRIVSWNIGAERLFGYTAQDAIGKSITMIIPPERQDEETMILERLRRGERIDHFETVRVSKSGKRIDVSVTISPIRDGAGHVVGASKIARDVSLRRHSEQTARFLADASVALSALTDYESTLRTVVNLAVPFFADWAVVDLVEANGSVRRLSVTHADPQKVQTAQALNLKFPVQTSDPDGVGKVIRTGQSEWASEIREEALANAPHPAEFIQALQSFGLKSYICVPLKSRDGVRGAMTFVTAESGRTYKDEDLLAAEDLAHRAIIAIDNARLLNALQESDRRKDEFLAILAHELRNPLAPIRNAIHILRAQGPAVPELEWARDVIDRQIQQMTRLVDDLLDVSRITRGKISLRKERIELAAVVNNAIESSRPMIDQMAHQLTVDLPQTPVVLYADQTRLSQILSNLLNNSAKYMERGGRIWLTAACSGDRVVVRVKDTGIGIPREMLPRIFDMFTQVDRTLERTQGGLGIGLTLVKRLIELHEGTIEAQSEGLGKGSEFVVTLPLAGGSDRVSKTINVSPVETESISRRFLVVDDNQDAAKSLAKLLQMMGHAVQTASDGLAAVEATGEFRPDVVLLDIGLPKLNGYQVAQRLRSEHGSGLVLIAVTGWGQDEDRRRSKEAGFDHHLTKPIDLTELLTILAAS